MGSVMDTLNNNASNPVGAMSLLDQEDYFSPSAGRSRRESLRRTNTEIRNTSFELRQRGFGGEVEEALEEPRSTTTRIFDGLQAANFALAGGVSELQEGGTYYDAFKRGASELVASSDIFDFFTDKQVEEFFGKAPMRKGFADVLRKASDRGEGDIPTAVGGMILDIALDPVTYASFGAGALGKVGKLAPFLNVYSAGYKGGKAILGTDIAQEGIKDLMMGKNPLLKTDSAIIKSITTIFGEGFRTNFPYEKAIITSNEEGKNALRLWLDKLTRHGNEKYLGTDELSEGLAGIVKGTPEAFADAGTLSEKTGLVKGFTENVAQGVKIKDFVVSLSSGLSSGERRMIGLFLDEPNALKAMIKKSNPERAPFIEHKIDAVQDFFRVLEREEEAATGIFSKIDLRSIWAIPKHLETSHTKKLNAEMKRRMGASKTVIAELESLSPGLSEALDVDGYENIKSIIRTLEQRLGAGTPTDLDFAHLAISKGHRTTSLSAKKRLVDSVFTDIEVAIPVHDRQDLLRFWEHSENGIKEMLIKENGTGKGATQMWRDIQKLKGDYKEAGWIPYQPVGRFLDGETGELKNLGLGDYFKTEDGKLWKRIDGAKPQRQTMAIATTTTGETTAKGIKFEPDDLVFRVDKEGKRFGLPQPIHKLDKGEKFIHRVGDDDVAGVINTKGISLEITAQEQGVKGFATKEFGGNDAVRSVDQAPTYLMHEEIVNGLKKVEEVFNPNAPDKALHEVLRSFDKYMSMWKGYATLSTGFLSRNAQNNVFVNWMAGIPMNPKRYSEAMRLQAGRGDEVTLKIGDEVFSGNEIVRLADKHGIRGSSGYERDIGLMGREQDLLNSMAIKAGKDGDGTRMALGEFKNPILDAVSHFEDGSKLMGRMSRKTGEYFGSGGKLLEWNRRMGGAMENNAKMVHFIHQIRKGMSPEDAARSVKKYLFDYGELTTAEREVFRRVLPFYTWTRKNVPLMFGELMRNPGQFAKVPKTMDMIRNLSDNSETMDVPDYFSEVSAVRMPKFVDRSIRDANQFVAQSLYSMGIIKEKPEEITGLQPVFYKPDLAFQDLDLLTDHRQIMSGLNPLLKVPFEMAAGEGKGYSYFIDRPQERYEGQPAEVSLIPGLPIALRRKHQAALESLAPTLGKINRLRADTQRGGLVSRIASEFAGFKMMQNDVSAAKAGKRYKLRDQLRNIKRKGQETGQIPSRR